MLIKSINWIITDVCNLRCTHCDIWQLPKKMLELKLAERLLDDPAVRKSAQYYGNAFDISLGGGEPFAHPKLQEIVNLVQEKYPGCIKSISTNGVLTKRIVAFLKANDQLNMKIMRANYREISQVAALAERLGCVFSCKPVDLMENYTNRVGPLETRFN